MSVLSVRRETDVEIRGSDTVYLFDLRTDTAADWVASHVSEERLMYGGSLVVEHRFVAALVSGMVSDGLIVKEEPRPTGRFTV